MSEHTAFGREYKLKFGGYSLSRFPKGGATLCSQCGKSWYVHSGATCPEEAAPVEAAPVEAAPVTQRTQKARGIRALAGRDLNVPPFYLVQSESDIDALKSSVLALYSFARPCPTKPRHGFVDSRRVMDKDELRALWQETMAADPQGEILLMPFLSPKQSMILTPTMAAVGTGHAGATSGDSSSIAIPIAALDLESLSSTISEAGITDTPYFEVVQSKEGRVSFVQLRDGVAVSSACSNIVPERVTVKRVMTASPETDWAQWEKDCANAFMEPGVVVHHPAVNPISHYAIHAVMNKLPLIFGDIAPRVGDILEKTDNATLIDLAALRQGLKAGLDFGICKETWDTCMQIIFYGTHHALALQTSPIGCIIMGAAAALFARFGTAACLGELRHHKSEYKRDCGKRERSEVYEEAFADYEASRFDLKRAYKKFHTGWWAGGMGGELWAQCTLNTMRLDRYISAACRVDALPSAALDLVKQLNINVHLAHNGGWWLNKFCEKHLMDRIAEGRVKETAAACFACAPVARQGRIGTALRDHALIPMPAMPPALLQIAIVGAVLKIQSRNQLGQVTFGKVGICAAEEAALLGFIAQLSPPRKKSMQGGDTTYYQVTPAFAACIELSLTTIHERLSNAKNSIS